MALLQRGCRTQIYNKGTTKAVKKSEKRLSAQQKAKNNITLPATACAMADRVMNLRADGNETYLLLLSLFSFSFSFIVPSM